MSDLGDALAAVVTKTTKGWKQAKREADKQDRLSRTQRSALYHRPFVVTVRDTAFKVMPEAYAWASSDGRYLANARQIMYGARPRVLKLTVGERKRIWKNSSYFTQTLLKDYLDRYEPAWRVVWDSRGHLVEPHTGNSIGLGGAEVGQYIGEWTADRWPVVKPFELERALKTVGPHLRYANVLFIEKEGFAEVLEDAGFAQEYDLAFMSTKGLPVGAACQLAAHFNRAGVRIFVVHDFDLAGFKIVKTLREGTRRAPGARVIDLGLRLDDVEALQEEDQALPEFERLQTEEVAYKQKADPREYLRWECDATEEECDFLVSEVQYYYAQPVGYTGERVELNAMNSERFIRWLRGKLEEHGVEKVVPDREALCDAYRRALFLQALEKHATEIRDKFTKKRVPKNLAERVVEVEGWPRVSWDEAVWDIARQAAAENRPTARAD